LRVLLERFFELPAELQEFRGGWMRLPEQARLRLGETEETGLLGQNTLIGASVWGCQQRFRIVLGPLPLSGFRRVLPGTDSLRRLVALVRNYIGDEKDWDLQLVLRRDEVPSVRLGDGSYLGWTSWLGGHDHLHDANDVVLEPAPGHGA
jgi:type VI secretion system protein ImpH